MKQETRIANRFYQMVAVLNPASRYKLNQCPLNDFPSIFPHWCLVDAFPRLWPMSGPSLEDFFHKVSDLPIGYENPRTNGRYFDVICLILSQSKHLKQNESKWIINTSRMLRWNWDASKGDWDCGCASTSFSFLGVGVGFLITEVQAHWWYKSQTFHQIVNVSRPNSAKSSIGSSMVLLVQYSAEKMSGSITLYQYIVYVYNYYHILCNYMMIMYELFIVFPCLSYSSICSGVDADKSHRNVGYIRSGLFSGSQEVLRRSELIRRHFVHKQLSMISSNTTDLNGWTLRFLKLNNKYEKLEFFFLGWNSLVRFTMEKSGENYTCSEMV